jgi:ADP-ribose pyrophosphatase YjhB (NUDIX family)
MINQTTLPIDSKYPERFTLPDEQTNWDVEVPHYDAPIYPAFSKAQQRLTAAGLVVASPEELTLLSRLNNQQASEEFGDIVLDLRNPLGRTGINGTGIYYVAGKSLVGDMAMFRFNEESGLEIAMVYNRNKWRVPGGFAEPVDAGNQRNTAVREAGEETNLDVASLADAGLVHTLIESQIKPRSARSADLGFMFNQVEVVLLPEYSMGDAIEPGDDAEAAEWMDLASIERYRAQGVISDDHYNYIGLGFAYTQDQLANL